MASLRQTLAVSTLVAACGAEPTPLPPIPEDPAFAVLPANTAVALVPTTPAVTLRCASELGTTWCSPAAALAAVRACRARLTADERMACDSERGCVAPYTPTRAGPCVQGPTYPTLAACATPVEDDCAFYRACLEASHPCGATGYALGFGEPLCFLFIDRRASFSPAGQRWLRGVRTCLQRSLAALVSRPVASCDALADEAYASHTQCYTAADNSFCALPPGDVLRLATLLGPYLRDPRAAEQTRAVARICAGEQP